MATRISRKKAKAEIAAVEARLRAGAPAIARPGYRDPLAVTLAARDLGVDLSSLRRRVGSPSVKGTHARDHRLSVDWSLAAALPPAEAVAAAERGELGTDPVMPGFGLKRVSTQRNADGETEREWIEQGRALGPVFAVPDGQQVNGVSALVTGDGREIAKWIKTGKAASNPVDFAERLRQVMLDVRGAAPLPPPPETANADLLTFYGLADAHFGALSWGQEVGESYDLRIAEATVRQHLAELVAMSPPSKHAVLAFMGDYTHMNDQTNATPTSHHQLDADGRWEKIYDIAARVAVWACLEVARRHEFVEIAVLPGNHDPDAAKTLRVALALYFEGHPRITVCREPGLHYFRRHGITLIGCTHGHTLSPAEMVSLLPVERPRDWGETVIRRLYHGHIHHVRKLGGEQAGVLVESLSPIAARGAYEAGRGLKSERAITARTFHLTRGEIGGARVALGLPASV
ncbi:hypothetical protein [Methylobacterium frigidaeris]|uniref:Calcineurin-like phosphoesterase domain-containing protein n=1 Tax=Methylobacterium frigidaeris TaxID=2038277 RepID=A0AA37HGN7_9HYPH|nr:hypothetical protein [Methylobacterium frigidaeris]PIK70160.1 hypothetical protein CS379_26145 [Methylobacterium frigidaeris]GJD65196.1 hypothetical protein MPEAHAMD_5383 [Methylobacterium frigidaeris]